MGKGRWDEVVTPTTFESGKDVDVFLWIDGVWYFDWLEDDTNAMYVVGV